MARQAEGRRGDHIPKLTERTGVPMTAALTPAQCDRMRGFLALVLQEAREQRDPNANLLALVRVSRER